MHSFVIVGFFVAIFIQGDGRSIGSKEEMFKIANETFEQTYACALEMGTSKTDQLSEIPNTHLYPEDNSILNELWGCILEKKGIINKQAVLNDNKLKDYLEDNIFAMTESPGSEEQIEADARDTVQQCKYVHGNDYGQTAIKLLNCIQKSLDQKS